MKQIVLIIILSLSLSSHCQKWVSTTSEWEYAKVYSFPPVFDNIKVTYEKDTVVLNQPCKKVKSWFQNFFTFEQNDTAFVFLDGQFRASYYFSANVNDTLPFYITNRYNGCQALDSILKGKVDSISYFSFNALSLKKWHISMIDSPNQSFFNKQFSYSERIGSSSFFYPFFSCGSFHDDNFSLCSYTESSVSLNFLNCTPLGVNNISPSLYPLYLSPNPANNSFTISIPSASSKPEDFLLFNSQGKLVRYLTTDKSTFEINCSELPDGVYFLKAAHFPVSKIIVIH